MSNFLAPIHYWLYGKILAMEDIERSLLSAIDVPNLQAYHEELSLSLGAMLDDAPLEDVIDQSNSHPWLQSKILTVETRQAMLIDYAYRSGDISSVKATVLAVYQQEGHSLGNYRSDNHLDSAPAIFKALGDVLLEGMPCDPVNVITDEANDAIRWEVVNCVHEGYWNRELLKVDDYYLFRAAFSRGFVEGLNDHFTYAFDNTEGQKHAIFKRG